MKKTILLSLLLAGSCLDVMGQCAPRPENVYTFQYNGSRYEVVKENRSWVNAAACAVSNGGKLAEINSQAEQDAIFTNVNNAGILATNTIAPDGGGASYLWIGGNDIAAEGRWVWDGDNNGASTQFWQGTRNGSAVGGLYNNWGNEPDNWGTQNGLGLAFTNWPLGTAGQWNDVRDSNRLYYVIEYPKTTLVTAVQQPVASVYPNPAGQFITTTFTEPVVAQGYQLEIRNMLGQVVLQQPVDKQQLYIDVSALSSNIYLLHIKDRAGNLIYQQKMVKQ